MRQLFGWVAAGAILLGFASSASAQNPQSVATGVAIPGAGYGYPGGSSFAGAGGAAYPGDFGSVDPAAGALAGCFTLYPLSNVYPYSYTGPGSRFGQYAYVPYPYAPIGYGWYGEWWRGW